MTRKEYNKLIRDRIPEIIEESGGIAKIKTLDNGVFRKALKEKVIEEAKELLESESDEDVLNELSDIEELVNAIAEDYGIPKDEIEKKRKNKAEKRGGFKKKLFLEYVDE
jgi:predicted house-cleaning noncanonical NTP pyrophosphatase (MazG superfamily)